MAKINNLFATIEQNDRTAMDASLTDVQYNLAIGGLLAYGFLINWLLLQFAALPMLRAVIGMGGIGLVLLVVGYFALTLTGSFLVNSMETGKAFLGYNLMVLPVGLVLSLFLLTADVTPDLLQRAFLLTGLITLGMMAVATAKPDWFSSYPRGLGIALLVTLVVELLFSLFTHTTLVLFDWVVVVIMSLYVAFDWVRANTVNRTLVNAIAVSASLYLDIVNILMRLIRILGKKDD